MESLIIAPPKKNIGNYECALPCQHVPVRIHRISQKGFLCVAGSSGFLPPTFVYIIQHPFLQIVEFLISGTKVCRGCS